MKVILVRHGETQNNIDKRSTGRSDIELTENGIMQAHETGKLLKNEPVDKIYSSSLHRAIQTAEIIKSEIQFTWDIIISELMKERDLGNQTNQPRSIRVEINQQTPEIRQQRMNELKVESDESLDKRTEEFINTLRKEKEKTILLVGHRGWFKRMLSKVLKIEISEDKLSNGSITTIEL
jgi:broad specificity phosphatase PhoE